MKPPKLPGSVVAKAVGFPFPGFRTACLRRMPYSSYAWNALGVAQARQGQLPEALESLSQGLGPPWLWEGCQLAGDSWGYSRHNHKHHGIPWHL